ALPGLADLQQKFSGRCKFQDHRIVEITLNTAGLVLVQYQWCGLLPAAGALPPGSGRLAAAISADPDIAFVVDGHSVLGIGPIITFGFAAEVPDEITFLIELKNRRGGSAAHRYRRVRRGVQFAHLKRALPMDDPDMILAIDGYADRLTQDPMIGQRLRP